MMPVIILLILVYIQKTEQIYTLRELSTVGIVRLVLVALLSLPIDISFEKLPILTFKKTLHAYIVLTALKLVPLNATLPL